jgi:hypothetical protein
MRTPFDDDTEYFSDQLSRLFRMLDLAPPTFHGRVLPFVVPEVIRWEIETKIEGRIIEPTTEIVVYLRMYPGWEIGVMMAIEEALVCICDMYSKEISKMDTSFHKFGRHNSEGWPMRTPGIRGGLPWTEIQLEDMESYAFNLEIYSVLRWTPRMMPSIYSRKEKIEQLEDTIQKLKDKKKSLEAANDKLTYKTEDQETRIAGLRG